MEVRLPIASSSEETGALLTEYLEARGVTIVSHGKGVPVISYGVPRIDAVHVLNRLPGKGKVYNMTKMLNGGVRTVPYWTAEQLRGASQEALEGLKYPMLARKIHGYGGTDIRTVFEPQEIAWRIASGSDWFSTYIPIETEFRVWAYRNEVLGTYKKQMNRPSDYKTIGRNFANGFDFVSAENDPDASEAAVKTLAALGYDFAAIDMIRGRDGLVYVLECNSAPGAIRSGAQETLGKLADRMVNWRKSL